jgi:hypothetical protein
MRARSFKSIPANLALLALGVAFGLAGCDFGDDTNPVGLLSDLDDGPLFVTQSKPATDVMAALFDGLVVVDGSGCPRLDAPEPDRGTVVWPYGFTLEARAGSYWVVDAEGRDVGPLGGHFRFGGGFVPTLHEGLALTDEARAAAESRCPGNYWIVGELP